jgi:segregation and condensation protein A
MADPLPDAAAHPAALIYGQPVADLPADLYIPPDALSVLLEAFEGPLDLLLYLIRKANIDILDIPMAPLTRQYLEYIEAMRRVKLELAADYLVMAAMLIEIKSRMLLPRPPAPEGEEPEDPRAELVRRLAVYERMKEAAARLAELPQADGDFYWADALQEKSSAKAYPKVSASDLQAAWRTVLERAKLTARHEIPQEKLSVREHMGIILRILKEKGGYVAFLDLFDPADGVPVLVVHFVALLELARERLADISQGEAFAPVYVKLAVQ